MNTNTMELNLDEMELISGGRWRWADALMCGGIGGICFGTLGACLGGVPGALIGATIGAAGGAGLSAIL